MMKNKHQRLALRDYTSKPREVLLFAPAALAELGGSFTPNYGLKKDLEQALSRYSPIERRILYRVLIQGFTFKQATQYTRRSSEYWRKWFLTIALPQLRKDLAEYFDDIRPARENVSSRISSPVVFPEVNQTVKCRYCRFTYKGTDSKNLLVLRNHVKEKHSFIFKKVQQKLLDSNYQIESLERQNSL